MTLVALFASQHDMFKRHKKGFILVCCTICFLLYVAFGGIIFKYVEGPQINQVQKDVRNAKMMVLQKFPTTSGEALDYYTSLLREIGIRGVPDPKARIVEWTFVDGMFFAVTLLTTIGYGHVSPKSNLGKAICILYTSFGIPVTLLHLTSYVNLLMKMSESYKAALFRKLQRILRPFQVRLIHMASIMALILLFCFIIPAIVFSHYEKGWGIFEGFYFSFISLTTVGLGDLVPALDPDMPYVEVYKCGAILFMIAGVTIMMFMMALASDFHQNFNSSYETLPYTISPEKISINPNNMASYGSILTHSGKSEDGKVERIIQP